MKFFPFKKKKEYKTPTKIIISRNDKIGDMILSMPAFFMARKMYPNAEIAVIASVYNAPLIKYFPYIDKVIKVDLAHPYQTAKEVRKFAADEFIALFSDKTIMKLAIFSGAKTIIGPISKPLSWFIYNRGMIQRRSKSIKNEAQYNLDLIKESNPKLYEKSFEIGGKIIYSQDEEKQASDFLESIGLKDPFILVHIFGGGSAKNFTPDEYGAVINKIVQQLPETPIILSAHGEEFHVLSILKNSLPDKNIFFYKTGDILSYAALIDKCKVFLGGSTGPTHIAGNLRKKVVAVFPAKKSQSKIRWGLFGNEENTSYIVPDEGNMGENYAAKTFNNITEDIIEQIATAVTEKFLTE